MSENTYINHNNSNDNKLLKRTKSRMFIWHTHAGGKCAPIAIRVPIHVGLISVPRGGDITMSWCVWNVCNFWWTNSKNRTVLKTFLIFMNKIQILEPLNFLNLDFWKKNFLDNFLDKKFLNSKIFFILPLDYFI